MQADFFRLCYVLVEGGFYVDADDVCIGTNIDWLAEDGRLKLQPLCYDIAARAMVKPAVFLISDAYDPSWIFYFNNNPLIASQGHPVIEMKQLDFYIAFPPDDPRATVSAWNAKYVEVISRPALLPNQA